MFLISLLHRHHPSLLYHYALILDRLTFLMLRLIWNMTTRWAIWQSLAVLVLVSAADEASPAGFWANYNIVILINLLTV